MRRFSPDPTRLYFDGAGATPVFCVWFQHGGTMDWQTLTPAERETLRLAQGAARLAWAHGDRDHWWVPIQKQDVCARCGERKAKGVQPSACPGVLRLTGRG